MKDDIIYVLVNEAMPGYVKIGRTTNLEQRIRSLDTTSVPLPFECIYACRVVNSAVVERHLHDAFLDHRVRSSREFFEISADRVISALKLAERDICKCWGSALKERHPQTPQRSPSEPAYQPAFSFPHQGMSSPFALAAAGVTHSNVATWPRPEATA